MNEQQNRTMDKQYILVPAETLVVCINTLKLIDPIGYDGKVHLVATVTELQAALQTGLQAGNKPEEIKLEVLQPEQTEAEK